MISTTTQDLLNCFTLVPSLESFQFTPALVEAALSDPQCSSVSTILVLYTGGTIGMGSSGGVYVPKPNFLVEKVMSMSTFQDHSFAEKNQIHVDYYKSKRIGDDSTHVSQTSDDMQQWPIICMPPTIEQRRIFFTIAEYSNLLDSSNCTMENWIQVAKHIKLFYDKFDGFVVLHGTDTLAYAASFLSFILEGLRKPVVVTGSQIPIGELRNDGRDNLLGSLLIASGEQLIPEVTVFFNGKLFRGNRVVKCSATDLDAFTSPNYPPLAEMRSDICVHSSNVLQPKGEGRGVLVNSSLCRNVVMLRVFPSITTETVQAFFNPPVEGVILQSYGTGNVPATRSDLLAIFKEATEKHGIIILNITQCWRGSVEAKYAAGAVLQKIGVIPGYDMTPEAALAKLAYVLGRWKDTATRRRILSHDLRGEMTLQSTVVPLNPKTPGFDFQEMPTGQAGIAQILPHVGSVMCQSTEDAPVNIFAQRLFPHLMCGAAEANDCHMLEQLYAITHTFEFYDQELRRPLHIAAANGHQLACKFLLENGACPNASDRYGYTAMTYAIRSSKASEEFITFLMKNGCELSSVQTTRAREVNYAARLGKVDQLKLYKLVGMSLQDLDVEGRTPLHVAVAYRQVDTVRYLITPSTEGGGGVDSTQKSSWGSSAYDEACQRQLVKIVALLNPCTA